MLVVRIEAQLFFGNCDFVRLALAHGIAQVRDVIARAADGEGEPALFATVDEAVASVSD